jgi:hypothetical protein
MNHANSTKRAPVNKPKPNTRFLRAIIKETDSHNAALLAKEAAESKARLHSLVTKDVRSGADIRRRQLGHITAHLTSGSAKRRRKDDEEKKPNERKRRRNTSSEEEEDHHETKRYAKERRQGNDKGLREGRDDRHSHHGSHRRHRSRSVERSSKSDRHTKDRSRVRSTSSDKCRSSKSRRDHQSPESRSAKMTSRLEDVDIEDKHRGSHHRRRSPALGDGKSRKDRHSIKPADAVKNDDDDSDPLDDIIGPRPPPTPKVRSRGRGTISAASGIDLRFSSNYDPTVDVQLDPDEENDWDQALEALKDRQKWRQQGADRLRAAGFTEQEIEKWEKGGEKTGKDVKWAKKGESREWDRGKLFVEHVEDEFATEVDANYGRLKDT